MMVSRTLLMLISSIVYPQKQVNITGPINWNEMIKISKRHGIEHLLYMALNQVPIDLTPNEKQIKDLEYEYYKIIVRNICILNEANTILCLFEKMNICAMPLKGYNTSSRYPIEFARNMVDFDVLTKPSQYKQINRVMKQNGFYGHIENRKHDQFWGDSKVCIEIHRSLVPIDSRFCNYYKDIWKRSKVEIGKRCIYRMSSEDEYIYTIIHLIEHLKTSGITIRFVLDVFIYNTYVDLDRTYLKKEFNKLKISRFVSILEELSKNGSEELNHVNRISKVLKD